MNLERIASLLSQNLKPSQVASIVGCSPARITQISQQEDFKLLLADKNAEATKAFSETAALDSKYLHAEHQLLNAITEQAPMADMRDNVNALRVITERQYRKAAITNPVSNGSVQLTQNFVQLNIPQHALPEISLNSLNEVIAINTQTLAPLSSKGVTDLFSSMKGNNHEPERIHSCADQNASLATQEVIPSQQPTAGRHSQCSNQHQMELAYEDTF